MARRTPIQIKLDKLRKAKGLRKSQALSFESERAERDTVTSDITIPDINYGAWSLVGQEYAPDYPGRKFDFI